MAVITLGLNLYYFNLPDNNSEPLQHAYNTLIVLKFAAPLHSGSFTVSMATDMVACLTLTKAPNGSEQSHVGRVITTCLKHAGRPILQCCLFTEI